MTQFILADNEKNNIFANEVHELQDYFSSKKQVGFYNETQKILGVLSDTFKSTHMFLYDNEFLLTKYPEGIVTENLLLIPVNKYEQLRKDFSQINREILSNSFSDWAEFFITPLVKNLELKLDMTIPDSEKAALSQEILKGIKNTPKFSTNKELFNFTVIKNKTLLDIVKNQDLSLEYFIEASLSSNKEEVTYLQYWLKKNTDLLENLPSVKQTLENIHPSTSVNINELKDNLRLDYPLSSSFKNLYQIYQIIDNMKAETGNDKKAFIENSSSTLIPVLELTDDFRFSSAVQYLKENIFPTYTTVNKNDLSQETPVSVLISEFCKELNKVCTPSKRDTMIKCMTDYNLFTSLMLSGDKLIKQELKQENITTKPKM